MKTRIAALALAVLAAGGSAYAQAPPGPGAEPDPLARARVLEAAGADLTGKVVGGVATDIAQNRWQVALIYPGSGTQLYRQFCGGSYLGNGWILTAAHCLVSVAGPAGVLVVAGATNLDDSQPPVAVTAIKRHPAFNPATLDSDVALIRVAAEQVAGLVQPIAIAAGPQPAPAAQIQVTGWGRVAERGTKSMTLKLATVPHQPRAICNAPDAYANQVTPNMFCAGLPGGQYDACNGDSGGPATAMVSGERRLVGIVSWGVGCGEPKRYGVYTRLSLFAPWVQQNATP